MFKHDSIFSGYDRHIPESIKRYQTSTQKGDYAGVARALATCGADARIAVLPQGPYLIATVRGQKRPLGGPAPGGPEAPWLESGPGS